MKRLNNIYEKIYDHDNLLLADLKASRGKSTQPGVIAHNLQPEQNLWDLHISLRYKTFSTSTYQTFTVREPKERLVFRLPYFPDRITHHALMNILEPIFVSTFTNDSYSCIKGKGIHAGARAIRTALRDEPGTRYCLKLDITKFYPSIDHDILKGLLRRKFKDKDLLWLLDEIIDSAHGLPIGNYLSQYLANFYLTYFDHWIKEQLHVKHYFRYADDIVILSDNKPHLHQLLSQIRQYVNDHLKLHVKNNYQVFPVASRGIDFLGYRFYHTHVLLRKRIKKNFARMIRYRKRKASIASYLGWAKHCNSINLIKKLLK